MAITAAKRGCAPLSQSISQRRAACVRPGDDVIIVPSVSDEQAREKFPGGWKSLRPYLRIVPQPR
jgi:hypothetical protein